MFTGIIQTTGEVLKNSKGKLEIKCPELLADLKKGSSVAVDGVCLTAVTLSKTSFTADVMPETLSKTVLGDRKKGALVNLELAMQMGARFEGHMVSGHVEGKAKLLDIKLDDNAYLLTFRIGGELDSNWTRIVTNPIPIRYPSENSMKNLSRYVIPKGSIALNGISLTVVDIQDNIFSVSIIPHTWDTTNLHTLKVGDKVNVETDMLTRYAEKLMNNVQ